MTERAPEPPPQQAPKLWPGAWVRIHSLTSAPHLNGQVGCCQQWDAAKERWLVLMPGGEVKSLKPDKLEQAAVPPVHPEHAPVPPVQPAPPPPMHHATPPPLINLQVGAVVRLHSLQSAPHLNGQVAVCESWDAAKGLWQVRLQNGELKALKAEKLEKAEFSASQAKQFGQSRASDFGGSWGDPVPPRVAPGPPPPRPPPASPWGASPWPPRPEHHPAPGMPPPMPSPWGTAGGVWGNQAPMAHGVWGAPPPPGPSPWQAQHPWGTAGGVFGSPLPPPPGNFSPPSRPPPPPPQGSISQTFTLSDPPGRAPRGSEFPRRAAGVEAAVPSVMPHHGKPRGQAEANDTRETRAHAGNRQAYGFEAQAEQEIQRGLSASRSRSPRRRTSSPRRRTRSPQRRRQKGEKRRQSRSLSAGVRRQRRSRPAERSRSRDYRNAAPVTPPLESKGRTRQPVAKSSLRRPPVAKASIPSKRGAASSVDAQPRAEAAAAGSRLPRPPTAPPREASPRHHMPMQEESPRQWQPPLPPAPPSRQAPAKDADSPMTQKTSPRKFPQAADEKATAELEKLEDLSVAEMKRRVQDIFERKNPAKVQQLDALFKKYAGSELVVYKQVCKKYEEPLIRPKPARDDAVSRDTAGSNSAEKSANDTQSYQRGVWGESSHSEQGKTPKPPPSPRGGDVQLPWRSSGVWGDSDSLNNEQPDCQERFERLLRRRAPTPSDASVQAFRGVWDESEQLHDDQGTKNNRAGSADAKAFRGVWGESDNWHDEQPTSGRRAPTSASARGQSPRRRGWGESDSPQKEERHLRASMVPTPKMPTARPSTSSTARPSAARPSARANVSLPRPTSSHAARAEDQFEEEGSDDEGLGGMRPEALALMPTAKKRSRPAQEREEDDVWDDDDGWRDDEEREGEKSGFEEFSPLSEEEEGNAVDAHKEWTEEEWAAWEEEKKQWYASPKTDNSWMEELDKLRDETVEDEEEDQDEEAEYNESPKRDWTPKKAAPWRAKKSSEKAVQEVCPAGHQLKDFETFADGACDKCGEEFPKGTKLHSCRKCNFDICQKCWEGAKDEDVSSPGQTKGKAKGGKNGNLEQKGQTKGKAKGKGKDKDVVKCPAGHQLKMAKAVHIEHECDKCERRLKVGTTLYGCRHCNYDLCHKCFVAEIAKMKGKGNGKGKKQRTGGKEDETDEKGGTRWKNAQDWSANGYERPEKLCGDNWEEPRDKVGFKIVKDSAPEGLAWSYPLEDESRRSFAGYLEGALTEEQCTSFFEKIRDGTDWKRPESKFGLLPRKTSWMVKKGCTCHYQYGQVQVEPEDYPEWMKELMEATMPGCGMSDPSLWPDSCNLNLYEDGGMSVGWHADDEKLFQGKFCDIKIISLSLGAARKFELRKNWPDDNEEPVTEFILGNGDLVTMEGMTQKHFQHRVPREEGITDPRINLTWRWVRKHTVHCPVSRGRTYSKEWNKADKQEDEPTQNATASGQ